MKQGFLDIRGRAGLRRPKTRRVTGRVEGAAKHHPGSFYVPLVTSPVAVSQNGFRSKMFKTANSVSEYPSKCYHHNQESTYQSFSEPALDMPEVAPPDLAGGRLDG